jgi:uncharacterized protein YecT (DUF1311 family)
MMPSEWDIALEDRSEDEVAKAAKLLLDVQRAWLRLGNAQLADIRDKIAQNEDSLNKGRHALDSTLGNLQDVQKVLETTEAFLGIVARVIKIAM